MPNFVKNIAVIVIIALGIVAYEYLGNQIMVLRVLAFLASLVLASLLFLTTPLGLKCRYFLLNARLELRKIKWADRKNTAQMTLIVFIVVVLVGLFLWIIDSIVSRLLQWIIS